MSENSEEQIVVKQPDNVWAVIPEFPDYEMNLLEEVRKIAKLRKAWDVTQGDRYIRLFKDGKFCIRSAYSLARQTFPQFYRGRQHNHVTIAEGDIHRREQ